MTSSSGSSSPAAWVGLIARAIKGTDSVPNPPANPPLDTPVK